MLILDRPDTFFYWPALNPTHEPILNLNQKLGKFGCVIWVLEAISLDQFYMAHWIWIKINCKNQKGLLASNGSSNLKSFPSSLRNSSLKEITLKAYSKFASSCCLLNRSWWRHFSIVSLTWKSNSDFFKWQMRMSLSIDHQYWDNITTVIFQAAIDQKIIREKLIASRLCKSFTTRSQLYVITKTVNGQL